MTVSAPSAGVAPQPKPRGKGGGWWLSLLLGTAVGWVYMANGRAVNSPDTFPTALTTLALLSGEGIYLDRFFPETPGGPNRIWYGSARKHGHVVSRYPILPALLVMPMAAATGTIADRTNPGWKRDPVKGPNFILSFCRLGASALVVLAAVVLHRILWAIGLGACRVSVPAVLAAALGSDLWAIGALSIWQHGPAALMLTLTAWLLLPTDPSRPRVFLAGVTAALMVACRATDLVFAVAALGFVIVATPRKLVWFLPAPILIGVALIGYNLWFFNNLAGGQAELEALHPETHAVLGPWSGDLIGGFLGTMLSPNRGLLVFSPWVAVTLATVPFFARRADPPPILRYLFVALIPYTLVLSKYAVWWGGHSFGPRYWTDVMPLLAIGLAYSLDWAHQHCRPVAAVAAVSIALSIGVQVIGAFYYPSDWNSHPTNVDIHHERLWDWRDNELWRCLTTGLKSGV